MAQTPIKEEKDEDLKRSSLPWVKIKDVNLNQNDPGLPELSLEGDIAKASIRHAYLLKRKKDGSYTLTIKALANANMLLKIGKVPLIKGDDPIYEALKNCIGEKDA